VHKERVSAKRFFGQEAGKVRVDSHRGFRLGFGAVYRCVCRGVKDDMGRDTANQSAHLIWYCQVNRIAIVGNDFTGIGKAALQLPTNLPRGPKDENA
jgi:hypothetical protein